MNFWVPNQIAAPNRRLRLGPVPWSFRTLISQGSAVGELVRPQPMLQVIQPLFVFALFFCMPTVADEAERLGGATNLNLIASPKVVKAWRTLGSVQADSVPLDYYEKTGAPVTVPTNLVTQVSKTLLATESYLHSNAPDRNCVFSPGVVLTFSNGARTIDVFICFDCDQLAVVDGKDKGGVPRRMGYGYFDPARSQLVKIVKQIFPKDRQMRLLQEKR